MTIDLHLHRFRGASGSDLTTTVWEIGEGRRAVSSAMLGGGIGPVAWVVNAQVPGDYARMDPVAHLREMADDLGLVGRGVGMLTAAAVSRTVTSADGGVTASATVGLRVPTWAAAPVTSVDPELTPVVPAPMTPGTINITVDLPVALTDAALVNAVMTVTEAKTQALIEAGYAATGTASDAVVVVVPVDGTQEVFAGPRSVWGGAMARAVHAAVLAGAHDYARRLRDGGL
ncbi:adenosylcobinamide amidohydrolase [Gordonia phthalatica]|uniref:Adenosylcobinamide amidohydrolase n=1 Tax=Gordonia phthalatica TaxID=1136941 RepID=A0A0N9N8K2_9ACTN|nr:adenosylcobinamide amidohydrolase [Gordonia phthalatica]ALG84475.1 adenosylcobinamide amidohydrolase [Gordonia phthalatica]